MFKAIKKIYKKELEVLLVFSVGKLTFKVDPKKIL